METVSESTQSLTRSPSLAQPSPSRPQQIQTIFFLTFLSRFATASTYAFLLGASSAAFGNGLGADSAGVAASLMTGEEAAAASCCFLSFFCCDLESPEDAGEGSALTILRVGLVETRQEKSKETETARQVD